MASAEANLESEQFDLLQHEWPALSEQKKQTKASRKRKSLLRHDEVPSHEDSPALDIGQEQQRTSQDLPFWASIIEREPEFVDCVADRILDDVRPRASQKRREIHRAYVRHQVLSGVWDRDDDDDSCEQPTVLPPESQHEWVDPLPDLDRIDISNPEARRWCAIQVQSAASSVEGPIIGNAFGPTLGYTAMVEIEAGRYGLPQVILSCRINKPRKSRKSGKSVFSQPVSKNPQEYYEFAAIWRPGVKTNVDGQFMIDDMHIQPVRDSALGQHPHKQAIIDMCPLGNGKKTAVGRIIAITFLAHATRVGTLRPEYWEDLPLEVSSTFDQLYPQHESLKITLWLKVFPNPKAAFQDWGRFLQTQVNMHIPPFGHHELSDGTTYYTPLDVRDNYYFASSIDAVYHSMSEQIMLWDREERRRMAPIWAAERAAALRKNLERARRVKIIDDELPVMPVYMTRFGKTGRPTDIGAFAKGSGRTPQELIPVKGRPITSERFGIRW